MGKLIIWSRDNPWIVIVVLTLLTTFFSLQARHIRVDVSTEGIMVENDPARPVYDETLKTFGSDNITVVYVKDRDLFTYEKLTAIEKVFYSLQDIRGVSRVDGLFSVTNFKGEDGLLTTNPLLDQIPEDPAELARIRADALRNPLLKGVLISADGTGMAITVTVNPDPAESEFSIRVANEIDRAIQPLQGKVEQVFQVGEPMTSRFMSETMAKDRQTLGALCLGVLLVTLVVGIRTVSGAVVPILTGGLTMVWTVGYMALVDIPINSMTAVVPVLMLMIGSTEDMYMLSEYLEGLHEGRDRMGAIAHMANKMGLAVLLTALTTFFGFLSISANEIVLLKQFSAASSFALFVNPIITVTLIPVYLRFLGCSLGFTVAVVKRAPNLYSTTV